MSQLRVQVRKLLASRVANLVLFEVCWGVIVLLAVSQLEMLAALFLLLSVGGQIWATGKAKNSIKLLLAVTILGSLLDAIPFHFGLFDFPKQTVVPWGYPLWMSLLWLNFASTLRSGLKWMENRLWLAGLFGFLGGPASYYAGQQLGAITLSEPIWGNLFVIGLAWAIFTPLVFLVSKKLP